MVRDAKPANCPDRFGEGPDDEINLVFAAQFLEHAATVLGAEAHAMGFVAQDNSLGLLLYRCHHGGRGGAIAQPPNVAPQHHQFFSLDRKTAEERGQVTRYVWREQTTLGISQSTAHIKY